MYGFLLGSCVSWSIDLVASVASVCASSVAAVRPPPSLPAGHILAQYLPDDGIQKAPLEMDAQLVMAVRA